MRLKLGLSSGVTVYNTPLESAERMAALSCYADTDLKLLVGKGILSQYYFAYHDKGGWEYRPELLHYKLNVALVISGIPYASYSGVFQRYLKQEKPLNFSRGQDTCWEIAMRALPIAKEAFLPALYPHWLISFGYNHAMYRAHIDKLWDDVHPIYNDPWEIVLERGRAMMAISEMRDISRIAKSTLAVTVKEIVQAAWEYTNNF